VLKPSASVDIGVRIACSTSRNKNFWPCQNKGQSRPVWKSIKLVTSIFILNEDSVLPPFWKLVLLWNFD